VGDDSVPGRIALDHVLSCVLSVRKAQLLPGLAVMTLAIAVAGAAGAATKPAPSLADGGLFGMRGALGERLSVAPPARDGGAIRLAEAGGAATGGEATGGDATGGGDTTSTAADGGAGTAGAGNGQVGRHGGAGTEAALPIAFRSLTRGPCHVSRFARGALDPRRCGPAARLADQGPVVAAAGFTGGGAGVGTVRRAAPPPAEGPAIAPIPLPAAGWLIVAGAGALLLGRRFA
jgi:hypothetical protein